MTGFIRTLNQEVFESLGFTFDGSYWVKEPFPFKFQLNSEESYSVMMDGVPVDQLPKPVTTNSHVVKLMTSFAPAIVSNAMKIASQENWEFEKALNFVDSAIDKAFETPNHQLQFQLISNGQNLSVVPANEASYTLFTGVQCKFKITIKDQEHLILCDPNCMSLHFVQESFMKPEDKIEDIKVEVCSAKDTWIPFFGVGVKRSINSNEAIDKQ